MDSRQSHSIRKRNRLLRHVSVFHPLPFSPHTSICLSSTALLKSFVDVAPDSHFPTQNLPYGVFRPDSNSTPRPAVAIGDFVLDLSAISEAGLFDGLILNGADCFLRPNLNKFLAMGRPAWKEAHILLSKTFILMILCFEFERTFIVLDKDFIKGDLSHGEPHVEGLFPELLPLRNWCIKKTT
ncbi:hypothetical protein Bca4012_098914 [Brassica carinata]|uniref:Fumarylacetoacetase n=1 Tax=Brassica oleracea var. oleracea TaxID=109376 RepID=A0A0D2ZPP2_BRAOL